MSKKIKILQKVRLGGHSYNFGDIVEYSLDRVKTLRKKWVNYCVFDENIVNMAVITAPAKNNNKIAKY